LRAFCFFFISSFVFHRASFIFVPPFFLLRHASRGFSVAGSRCRSTHWRHLVLDVDDDGGERSSSSSGGGGGHAMLEALGVDCDALLIFGGRIKSFIFRRR